MTLRERFHEVWWKDPTGQLEGILSLALFLRGAWMLVPPWNTIPLPVQGYLIPSNIPEQEWGSLLIALAIIQFVTSMIRASGFRGLTATIAAIVQGIAMLAYWNAGLAYRGVVPLIITITIGEMVVAWRAWHDPFVAKVLTERRINGDQHH